MARSPSLTGDVRGLVKAQLTQFGAVFSSALRSQIAKATANARKYILLTTNTHDVLQFDLQTKIREDLLEDVTVTGKH